MIKSTDLTCGQLIASWLLIIVGFGLICRHEHIGFLLAFLPLVGAQRIRDEHDRATLARCKESSIWKAFALSYYFGVLILAAAAVLHQHDIANDPLCLLLTAFFFPFIVAMLVADCSVCSRRRAERVLK